MKAKEYFNKYKNGLASDVKDTFLLTFLEMYQEMFKECVDIMETRQVKGNDAVVSVFKEMNEKYNAICRLLAKEYGNSQIKENGFAVLACDTCEFLKPHFSKELNSIKSQKGDKE